MTLHQTLLFIGVARGAWLLASETSPGDLIRLIVWPDMATTLWSAFLIIVQNIMIPKARGNNDHVGDSSPSYLIYALVL